MSKIRIYELAKELGIDNKQVIACAHKLGLTGKSSHSNSLEDDEADLIRRALLRDAMGTSKPGGEGSTSVRGATGYGGVIVRGRSTDQGVKSDKPSVSFDSRKMIEKRASEALSVGGSGGAGVQSSGSIVQRTMTGEVVLERREGNMVVHRRRRGDGDVMYGKTSPEGQEQSTFDPSVLGLEGDLSLATKGREQVPSEVPLSEETKEKYNQESVFTSEMSLGQTQETESFSGNLGSEEGIDGSHDDSIVSDSYEVSSVEPVESVVSVDKDNRPSLEEDRELEEESKVSRSTKSLGNTGFVAVDSKNVVDSSKKVTGPKVLGMISNFKRRTLEPGGEDKAVTKEVAKDKRQESVEVQVEPTRLIRAELPKTSGGVVADAGPKVLGRIQLPIRKGVLGQEAVRWAGDVVEEDEDDKGARKKGRVRKREISRKDLLDYDGFDARKGKGGKGSGKANRNKAIEDAQKHEFTGPKQSKRVVRIDEFITVGELARQMSLKVGDVISKLIALGVMATINQTIDKETATVIAEEFEYQIESIGFDEDEMIAQGASEEAGIELPRPPVVTVMGHVDHGKTSLLDRIRKTSIADKEHGGITQHVGAYQVILEGGRKITFLDTPGHAAFTAMRARGANITDVVILVVAADDGVMPQTIEALNHAKAAGVPIVVAVNKIDRARANQDRVRQQLADYGLQPEEWGGDTIFVPVSALTGEGIDNLLESVLLVAEIKELKAVKDTRARGTVIEAAQERGFGTVATILVQHGALSLGDIFVAGAGYGRVRSLRNDRGERVEIAEPATPVRVTGFTNVPLAGDDFIVVESENVARDIAENRSLRLARAERARESGPISIEEFHRRAQVQAAEELNVILKADVQGSVEAVKKAIQDLSTDKVIVKVLHSAVGGITESDVQLAIASSAIIFGFGVRAEPRALSDAEAAGITISFHRVIYELIDAVKKAMVGLLAPEKEEVALGRAEVRDTFVVPKVGTIAGCYISDGIIKRGSFVRVLRDNRVIYEGKLGSLRRFKEDVKQVQSGYECGLGVENFNDVKVGDVFEVYELKEVAASL
jgi:translation initiation factor IF-2